VKFVVSDIASVTASHLSEFNAAEFASRGSQAPKASNHLQTLENFQAYSENSPALRYTPLANCNKARAGRLELPHGVVETPVFMPVGTQGTIKGVCSKQIENMGIKLILGNTYHLGVRPGTDVVHRKGGLHHFMNWNNNLLTDSGGFQMVSLVDLIEVTEAGVNFKSPIDGSTLLLTPERSIQYQNELGADIMMALDDVISSLTVGPRVEEAMERSIRWLDRCMAAHKRQPVQNLFGIIQGGLDRELRKRCLKAMIARDLPGYAIGGLAGGEDKHQFWNTVDVCTDHLPNHKPRYLMGVGYPVDLLVCVAMGVDMFDCVWPCRTARFGTAIVPEGLLKVHKAQYAADTRVLCDECPCPVCKEHKYPRAYLHHMARTAPLGAHLLTIHNLGYLKHYMSQMRASILEGRFHQFVDKHLRLNFPDAGLPAWVFDALTQNQVPVAAMGFTRSETAMAAADVRLPNAVKHTEMVDPSAAEALRALAAAALPVDQAMKELEEAGK
jgi:queuine tRNA-ribosyltransferase